MLRWQKLTEENLKQKYNDFHKNHTFFPYLRGQEGRGKKEGGKTKGRGETKGRGKRWKEKEKGQNRQEKYFFSPVCKKEGNSEVSANNVINWVSLY